MHIDHVVTGQRIARVHQVDYHQERTGADRLEDWVDQAALDHLDAEAFGKRILKANCHDWTSEDIVLAYRGQGEVEAVIWYLKDRFTWRCARNAAGPTTRSRCTHSSVRLRCCWRASPSLKHVSRAIQATCRPCSTHSLRCDWR